MQENPLYFQDMSDLFGCDLPSEEGSGFSWRDGPLLKALKQGNWILLDEMNLASQAVLEGAQVCYIFFSTFFWIAARFVAYSLER